MKKPLTAWRDSLPWVLAGPLILWLAVCMFSWVVISIMDRDVKLLAGVAAGIFYGIFCGAYGMVVHAVCYTALGIPLFIYGYRRPNSSLWIKRNSVILGGFLGMLVLSGMAFVNWWGERTWNSETEYHDWLPYLAIGLLYGTWTGWCAQRQKPMECSG